MSGINILIQNGTVVPCSAVVQAPFPAASDAFPSGEACSPSASTATPGRCHSIAEHGHQQLPDKLVVHSEHTENRRFSWPGALLGNLHAVSEVLAGEKNIESHFRDNLELFQVFWVWP